MGGKRDLQRERIFAEALRIFCARGIERTQMTEISEASGISRRTLYTYFSDKETLALALFSRNLENLFSILNRIFSRREECDEDLLERFLRGYYDIRRKHPDYVYYDYISNNYCAGRREDPSETSAFSAAVAHITDGRNADDPAVKRLLKSPKALCLHLYFCYLQKSVLQAVQSGDLFSKKQDRADRRYLDFLIASIRK